MTDNEIPYTIIGDCGFFKKKNVAEITRILNFLVNNKAKLGDLKSEFLDIQQIPEQYAKMEALEFEKKEKDCKLPAIFEKIRLLRISVSEWNYNEVQEIFFKLLELSPKYKIAITNGDDQYLYDIGTFTNVIQDYDLTVQHPKLYDLVQYLYTLRDDFIDERIVEPNNLNGSVNIMTVHQAKGLEFPIVIIYGAMNGRFPLESEGKQTFQFPNKLLKRTPIETGNLDLMDERRLFYVASTRAKKLLIITYATHKKSKKSTKSVFIDQFDNRFILETENIFEIIKYLGGPIGILKSEYKRTKKRFSYSSLEYYILCPRWYKLIVDCEIKPPQRSFYSYGLSLHSALEEIHRIYLNEKKTFNNDELEKILEKHWYSAGYKSLEESEKFKMTAQKILIKYYLENKDFFNKIFRIEEPFLIEIFNNYLVGKIDLIMRGETGLHLIDFKTGGIGKDFSPLSQLSIYALSYEKLTNEKVEKIKVYYLKENKIVEFKWEKEKKKQTKEKLKQLFSNIEQRKFPATPGTWCKSRCDYRKICDAIKKDKKK